MRPLSLWLRQSSDAVLARTAHLAPSACAALALVYPLSMTGWVAQRWMTPLFVAASLVPVVMMTAIVRHMFVLCPACAAMTPLDGHAAATRRRRALGIAHRPWPLAVALALPYLGFTTSDLLGNPSTLWYVLGALLFLGIAVEVRALLLHLLLRPWCPYCRGWDRPGEHEPSPDPDPASRTTPTAP